MTDEISKLQQKWFAAKKDEKEAWSKLAAAIVLSAPVRVGDVIAVADEDANASGTFKIDGITAVDWHDKPRYTVRRKTKNGWHSTIMSVPGLSSDINKGLFKLVEQAS